MDLRIAALLTFVAALPLSVDAPPDSAAHRGQTRLEAVGGVGQYGLVTRGCEGQTISVLHRRLELAGLAVEHETPAGIVIGVRGGQVRHEQDEQRVDYGYGNVQVSPGWSLTNRYVNPFVSWERRFAGVGFGWLQADEPFLFGEDNTLEPDLTGHVRFGDRRGHSFTIRYMEDVPLESEGHLSMQFGWPGERFQLSAGVGLLGPYDGALFGLKGRFWVTPEAAAVLRVSLTGNRQYNVLGGFSTRWPGRREPQ